MQRKFEQVADAIRRKIVDGTYATGERLPNEDTLANEHQVARPTIRQALDQLRAEGRIVTRSSTGSFVTRPARLRRVSTDLSTPGPDRGWWLMMRQSGLEPVSKLTVQTAAAPPDVTDLLGLDHGASVLIRHRIQGVEGERPMQVTISYVPLDVVERIPVLTEDSTGHGGGIRRLEDAGFAPLSFEEIVGARRATTEEIDLGIAADETEPVLTATGITYAHDGRPVHVMLRTMSTRRMELGFKWDSVGQAPEAR